MKAQKEVLTSNIQIVVHVHASAVYGSRSYEGNPSNHHRGWTDWTLSCMPRFRLGGAGNNNTWLISYGGQYEINHVQCIKNLNILCLAARSP